MITKFLISLLFFKVIVEKAERSDIPDIDKKKYGLLFLSCNNYSFMKCVLCCFAFMRFLLA